MSFIYKLKKSILLFSLFALACSAEKQISKPSFKQYWYEQGAEINRFELKQMRYGEKRQAEMTMIFVTEPLNTTRQVKSDVPSGKNVVSGFKLNVMRKFNTGVYPYSTMTSVFTEMDSPLNPMKITFSAQEWCGMVYHQLNQKGGKWLSRHYSYFETEGDQEKTLNLVFVEDGLLNLIRLDPSKLPVGDVKIIPSLFFIRLSHQDIKVYQALAESKPGEYKLTYPNLKRELSIYYETDFPYKITSWKETRISRKGEREITTAKNVMVKMMPYWEKNSLKDEVLRKELGYE